ncbi:hypothetical protein CEXT_474541 [Caerostris extrusa]|uniref:Uncharacterized protein n=1 Tax=Caerostris extrusa TaxID=172846 RepID=A0AAV4NSA7_CAEEX|nr:hypothetical protein CEXT_474541 [Caerostris extrusa]
MRSNYRLPPHYHNAFFEYESYQLMDKRLIERAAEASFHPEEGRQKGVESHLTTSVRRSEKNPESAYPFASQKGENLGKAH